MSLFGYSKEDNIYSPQIKKKNKNKKKKKKIKNKNKTTNPFLMTLQNIF
jgi:hypothetical protein